MFVFYVPYEGRVQNLIRKLNKLLRSLMQIRWRESSTASDAEKYLAVKKMRAKRNYDGEKDISAQEYT